MKFCKLTGSDTLRILPESVTVCATVDECGDEHVITEMMIRRACEQMDGDQPWPFAGNTLKGSLRRLTKHSATILPFPQQVAVS